MSFAKQAWWKKGTAYQIWPASYKDSNGDGIGDIPGVISTLDYLKDLGVDIIWLSPMYDSPQIDMGYDISDYQAIYPPFGTMDDMDKLIAECHGRGMKLILDLVINHTSDQHKWFQESKKDKTNPKADWFIWRDPKIVDGKKHPPNNWRSIFGGSAWEYSPERDQYYLHLFVKEQPDLNWEPDYVRKAIYKESIEFWLDKGIDGFRVDTVCIYSKDPTYPDAAVVLQDEPWQPAFHLFQDGPRIHEWLQEQRRDVLDKYGDVFMVGEGATDNYDELIKYTGTSRRELSCNFDFDVVDVGTNRTSAGKKHHGFRDQLPAFKKAFAKIQTMMMDTDCWGTVFMENHDQPRALSRFATDKPLHRENAAKMLALMSCCLSGTLFIYQGQEIGTYNHGEWPVEDIRDVDSLNYYNDICQRYDNDPYWKKKALRGIRDLGRDNARLPVQWDASPNAGFTTGKPWIRVHDDYANVNVADQQSRQNSPLNFWKTMLKFRKQYSDLCVFGDFEAHDMLEQKAFTYVKFYGERCEGKGTEELLVCCSFSDEEEPLDVPVRLRGKEKELLVGTYGGGEENFLRPWEARVYLVK